MLRPIVFVHGAFCGGWAFDAFRAPFEAAGFETHAPFLPHHERGADLDQLSQCGVRNYAEAIADYASGLGQPPILVGHSMGGLVVQLAAARIEAAALVMIGSSAPWGVAPTTFEEHGNSLGLMLLGDYWRRPIMPDFTVALRTTLDRLPRESARHTFTRFVPESGRAILETVQWWLDHGRESVVQVERIRAPVLAIAGGVDRVNPASTIRRIASRFPPGQARFQEFAGMSHWLIGEPEWPAVAQHVLAWLEGQGVGAGAGAAGRKPSRARRGGRRPVFAGVAGATA